MGVVKIVSDLTAQSIGICDLGRGFIRWVFILVELFHCQRKIGRGGNACSPFEFCHWHGHCCGAWGWGSGFTAAPQGG